MQFSKHESDLYVLPESDKDKKLIVGFLKSIKRNFVLSVSNVNHQKWYKKQFIDIPFGFDLKPDIERLNDNFYYAVYAKRWFCKDGNTYHSCDVYSCYGIGDLYHKTLIERIPFEYGYGEHYLNTAYYVLVKNGYYPKKEERTQSGMNKGLSDFYSDLRKENSIFAVGCADVHLKRDL
jgi:hypothetical protein